MTLQELKKYADEKAIDYGIHTDDITIMACVFGADTFSYITQAWDRKNKKHITARQSNPSSSLVEFGDKLEIHFKEYSKEKLDINL